MQWLYHRKNGDKTLLSSWGAHSFIPVGTDDCRLQASRLTFVVIMKTLSWKHFVSFRYILAHVKHTYDDGSLRSDIITVEPGYNDVGLCDTPSIATGILWYYVINSSLLTITLDFSVRTTVV
jgi:hypothetical protein